MGTKEVIARRGEVAHAFSMLMLDPDFMDHFENYGARDADGDVPVIIAAPEESAVVTLHRFERLGTESLLLVTAFDENIHVHLMRQTSPDEHQSAVDLIGGQTVRQWVVMMTARPGVPYTADGSDIMPQRADSFAVTENCH